MKLNRKTNYKGVLPSMPEFFLPEPEAIKNVSYDEDERTYKLTVNGDYIPSDVRSVLEGCIAHCAFREGIDVIDTEDIKYTVSFVGNNRFKYVAEYIHGAYEDISIFVYMANVMDKQEEIDDYIKRAADNQYTKRVDEYFSKQKKNAQKAAKYIKDYCNTVYMGEKITDEHVKDIEWIIRHSEELPE